MGKYALLIGVGEYGKGLTSLPAAPRDVAAFAEVLQNPQMGGFDEVKPVINPNQAKMAREIELWFQGREPDDLVLLFFSGHGVKDDRRELFFAARNTEKQRDYLIRSTATPAQFIRDCIRRCKAKYQVIILDCCYSGAFGDFLARDDGEINLKEQLGAEGCVVLTATNAVDYAYEEKGADLSIYTRYLVEGIVSGAADEDEDGAITVEELHRFARRKVEETSPVMSPKMITLKDEGYRIRLAQSPKGEPKLKYRKIAEQKAEAGKFSSAARQLLDILRLELGICELDAQSIEAEVLKLYQEYLQKLQIYKNTLRKSLKDETILNPNTIRDLVALHTHLGLKPEDVASIEEQQKTINNIRKRPDLFDFNFSTGSKDVEYNEQKSDPNQQIKAIQNRYVMAKTALDDALLVINDDLDELYEYRKWLLREVLKNYEMVMQPFKGELSITRHDIPTFRGLKISLDYDLFDVESDIASICQEKLAWKKYEKVEKFQCDVDKCCTQMVSTIKTLGVAAHEIQYFYKLHEFAANGVIQYCGTVKELNRQQ